MSYEKDVRLEIVEFLKSKGWNVILIADHGVKKPDSTPYRYQYTMDFIGKHPDYDTSKEVLGE